MKKWILIFFFSSVIYADSIIFENQTSHPAKEMSSKIAIQWANSVREVHAYNEAVIQGLKLKSSSLKSLKQQGKFQLNIPKNAEYFRVLVWPKGSKEPKLLTNWVEIIPNKIYQLREDHLISSVLLFGLGC